MSTVARRRERRKQKLIVLAILVVGVILTAEAFVKMTGRAGFAEFAQNPVVRIVVAVSDRALGL